jgi:hypothetical protein
MLRHSLLPMPLDFSSARARAALTHGRNTASPFSTLSPSPGFDVWHFDQCRTTITGAKERSNEISLDYLLFALSHGARLLAGCRQPTS